MPNKNSANAPRPPKSSARSPRRDPNATRTGQSSLRQRINNPHFGSLDEKPATRPNG